MKKKIESQSICRLSIRFSPFTVPLPISSRYALRQMCPNIMLFASLDNERRNMFIECICGLSHSPAVLFLPQYSVIHARAACQHYMHCISALHASMSLHLHVCGSSIVFFGVYSILVCIFKTECRIGDAYTAWMCLQCVHVLKRCEYLRFELFVYCG